MELMVIADPLADLDREWDTTLALMDVASRRGHRVRHCCIHELALTQGRPLAKVRELDEDGPGEWAELDSADVILFRKDPPLDRRYLAATFILDFVDLDSTLVVNDPRGVRLANEKIWALRYPDLCPPTLVTADGAQLEHFVQMHGRCVAKPVDGHAGIGVVRVERDSNRTSIVELLTDGGTRQIVIQPWLEEVVGGNKRIFLHDGHPAGAVLRFPQGSDFRIGMPSQVAELTERDREICERLAPELRSLGLILVGLDIIGDQLIEVNVTSSGALHKTDRILGTTLCADLITTLEASLPRRRIA
jgi:glutathione synthase